MSTGKYLFIRILEACNANCFMCDFAKSKDEYRFSAEDLTAMLPRLYDEDVRYIRFTGGEPLMHKQIVELISAITKQGIKSSIITNGAALAKKAGDLANAGLGQIIVSIDGLQETHDRLRGTPGLYERCIKGLQVAGEQGIMLRVNSVVGPDNYREMPQLQDVLTDLGVVQWEMSSLKLGGRLDYAPEDRSIIESLVIPKMFVEAAESGKLIPFGKIWCGDTEQERDLYFSTGITPRADGICHVVDHIRYYDPRNGKLYACSLIPHRVEASMLYPAFVTSAANLSTNSPDIKAQADFFRAAGPKICSGCSTTAAGFSNKLCSGEALHDWAY